MRRHQFLFAATTTLLLFAAGAASAQPVYIFDQAPSLEQLRSIVIPESRGGLSRSIVMLKQDGVALPSPVQSVVASTVTAPPVPVQPVVAMQPVDTTSVEPVAPRRHIIRRVVAATTPRPAPAAAAQPSDPAPEASTVGFRINFAFDSAILPESGRGFVDRIAELMKETPDLRLRVEGHTDATGAPGYNLELSKRRALTVAEYLVDQGIAAERFVLVGKGMSEPLTENASDPRNRRVQFVRLN